MQTLMVPKVLNLIALTAGVYLNHVVCFPRGSYI